MKPQPTALSLLLLLSPFTQAPVSAFASPPASQSATIATPHLHVAGGRDPRQRIGPGDARLDSALWEISANLGRVNPRSAVADLHSMSPAARFMQRPSDSGPLVLIDAVTRGDPQRLKSALLALGLQKPSVYLNDVSGWLPVSQLQAAAARAELHSIRAAMPRTRAGAITSQGDFAQRTDVVRTTYSPLNGTGVLVGALSDSYNCYPVYAQNNVPATGPNGYASNGFNVTATQDVTSGDLPSGVTVVREADCMSYGAPTLLPFGDEGRAMLQIVHDVAPGASLAFYTAENGQADFAAGIQKLATNGAKVIVDDVGYFEEPFFQDGVIAQAVDTVVAQGVAYFSSAGNDGANAYENTSPVFNTLSNSGPTSGQYLLNFDNSGNSTANTLQVDIPGLKPGGLIALILQWDQPYVTGAPASTGATSHLNLCVTGSGSDNIINLSGTSVTCTGPNSNGADPVQILIIDNPADAASTTAAETINVTVSLADGTAAPGRIKLAVDGGGRKNLVIHSSYAVNPTVQGHAGAAGAAAVGAAAFYSTPRCGTVGTAQLERYSSVGGGPILFDKNGTRLAQPVVRQKPSFVAPDGGNDTFLGFKDTGNTSTVGECANNTSYPNFFGTSAAAPHAAALAALMLQANSTLTPAQIYQAMQSSALPMPAGGGSTPDYNSGYGLIQGDAAVAAIPTGTPTLTLAKTTLNTNETTTLSWLAVNTTSCSASGGWSGAQNSFGSTTITAPATAGTVSYALSCTGNAGPVTATAQLTVTDPPRSGGGGGAFDEWALSILAVISGMHLWAGARPRSRQSCRARTADRCR